VPIVSAHFRSLSDSAPAGPAGAAPGGPVYVIVAEKKIYSTHLAAVWGDFKFFYLGKRGIPHQKMPIINTRSELE